MVDRRAVKGALILSVLGILAFLFISKALSAILFLFLICHVAFFRDPKRNLPAGNAPVSPADGTVVEISEVFEDRFLKEHAVKIGMFLSVFVPHVNRAPVDGTVRYLNYRPGKFLNALKKDSVNLNESNWIGTEQAGEKKTLIRQIAGAIAKRICCDVSLGQNLKRGEKVGIICYGSRMECYLPKRYFKSTLRLGDKVKAGETILGEWLS